MKFHRALLIVAVAFARIIPAGNSISQGNAAGNGLARTPPMGWHPWNKFGEQQDVRLIKEIADSLVSKGMNVLDSCEEDYIFVI